MSRLDRFAVFLALLGAGNGMMMNSPIIQGASIAFAGCLILIGPSADPSPPPARGRDDADG